MFLKILKLSSRTLLRSAAVREASTSSQWDIMAGICVERMPIVTAPLNDIQKSYKKLLSEIENEQSLKSDHELRHENDRLQAELLKKESQDVNLDAVSKFTAQDFEDACNEEFSKLVLADIVTDADRSNNKLSLNRSLQRHLVLVTNHEIGQDTKMLLPQGTRIEGETLRQTAERVLLEHCGETLKVQFLGNAPCGFYKYKYPAVIDGKVGAKVFFYYAKYQDGNVNEKKTKYEWLSRSELEESLPERYHSCVADFLVAERF